MNHPLLCATVAASSLDDLRRLRDEAGRRADLVELRLDALRQPEVEGALAGRACRVIITCRPRWEGGGFDGPEEVRRRLLRRAVELGADFVDVEWRADAGSWLAAREGRGVVLSRHDFDGTPDGLLDQYAAMRATGAEVVKLAVTARSLRDTLRLRDLGRRAAADGERAALVGMGPAGVASRVLPGHFGSCWTYAGDGVAPGQLSVASLLGEFRFREVTAATRVYGVAGRPVGHSLSPAMHNAAFRARGIDAVYLPLDTADADDLLAFAEALPLAGISVTAPLKVALFAHAGSVDEVARRTGAVNTLRWREERLEGRNADVAGFLAPLGEEDLSGVRAAVLGTGGAARAVVAALASRGARIGVFGRDERRAAAVASLGGGEGRCGVPARGGWDLLVNATPVGTWPDVEATPMAEADLRGGRVVYDLVYNPPETALCRAARAAGCRTIGGLEMLVAQAAIQFEWWTGCEAPVGVMREAAVARLGETRGQ